MADRIGQQLGHYRLVRLLGQGGFAEVYLGEHIHLGTEAAVKLLHTQLAGEDTEAFRTEARTIARLVHPHIVRVFDFGIEGETPYLVMDYAPGGTVRKRHPRGVALPMSTVLNYVKQVADALQYAHDEHFIHRDIKPENLLVGRHQEILLSDFGIALLAQTSRSQSMQDVTGTASYMAPEQFQGKPRRASDQYALAVMIYEWLTGACPFRGSFTEIASQHLFVPPPPLREKVPGLASAVEQVVMIALAKDPHQRFASVRAFAHALEQASQGEQEDASAPTLLASTRKPPPQPAEEPPLSISAPTLLASSDTEGEPSVPVASPFENASISAAPLRDATTPPSSSEALRTLAPIPSLPQQPSEVLSASSPLGTTLYTYRGHSYMVTAVAWSPDSRRIASGGYDCTVQVWDAVDGGHVFTYQGGSRDEVFAVAWSPDGRRIASASDDEHIPLGRGNTVQVWDAVDGGHVFTYQGGQPGEVHAVAWSPDGQRLASGWPTVQVCDAADGSSVYVYRGHSGPVTAVAWSPNGKHIASASSDKTVQVWNAANGSHIFTYHGHSDLITDVAWSPDGRRIASASFDRTVQVWDAVDGGHVYTYRGHSEWVFAVAWSPDGTCVASGGRDKTVQIWDSANGGYVCTYPGHPTGVNAIAWSPDGTRIVSGGNDSTVQVWQAEGPPLSSFASTMLASADAQIEPSPSVVSPSDSTLIPATFVPNTVSASPSSESISTSEAASSLPPTQLAVPTPPKPAVKRQPVPSKQPSIISPPPKQVARVTQPGTLLCTFRGHPAGSAITALAWSPDSRRIASGDGKGNDDNWKGTVQVWDAVSGSSIFSYRGHSHSIRALAWSPDGRRIASGGSSDKTVQVWNATDGGNVYTYHNKGLLLGAVWAVAWSPDGRRIASGSSNKKVQVWNALDGTPISTFPGNGGINATNAASLSWSPDGRRISSISENKALQVWNAADGTPILTYRGHSNNVIVVAWSPDGRYIASGSLDKTVQVWNAVDGSPVFSYRGHSDWVFTVAWSPDSRRIASASKDRTVQVWDATTGGNVFTYRGHPGPVLAVAWSPDGTRIASGSVDVQVWQAV